MIKKEAIEKWLDEKIWNKAKNDMAGFYEDELLKLIHDCITDLSQDKERELVKRGHELLDKLEGQIKAISCANLSPAQSMELPNDK